MDKRVVQFVAIAIFILLANLVITSLIGPRQPVAPKKPDVPVAAKPPGEGEPPAAAEQAAEDPAETDRPAESDKESPAKDSADQPEGTGPAETQPAAELKPAAPAIPQRRVSLGSYDPSSGYRLLVTLTSQGAAVERVELNQPQYRELEDRSGYLGHLAPVDAPDAGGCLVQVVGRGTPAAEAGLEVGDVLTRLAKTTLKNAADLEAALKTTEPGQEIELEGERGGQPLHAKARLARRPLEIIRPELKSKPVDVIADGHDPLSLLFTLEKVGKQSVAKGREELPGLDLREGNWQLAESDENHAEFRQPLPKLGLEVVKRFTVAKAPDDAQDSPFYHLLMDIVIRNVSGEKRSVAYRLDGPTGLPLEGSWYANKISRDWSAAGMRDVVLRFDGNNSPLQIGCLSIADDKPVKPASETDYPLDFIAVDAQYFSSALMPQRDDPTDLWFADVRPIRVGAVPAEKSEKKQTDVSFRLITRSFDLEPDAQLQHSYRMFAGPKKPPLLDQYVAGNSNLGELVYYGWFGWVARPMLGLLHAFYMIVRNYGVAIIMLTVLVRGCMMPLSRKQASSAQKMQELGPEIKRINEKFKKPEDRTKAQQELFRKHNYNPLGGCLLMFIQLPIFVGLYRSLLVDVELRQAPLISHTIRWASNLAAPDMFWDWSHTMPSFVIGFLGPYLNLFPLVTIGLFIWQQKMFMPPPADEQAALQQKMMSYMMIFVGVMFFKVASGLCLYFIASSLWGIAERKLLPKSKPPGQEVIVASATSRGGGGGNGSPPGKKRQHGPK